MGTPHASLCNTILHQLGEEEIAEHQGLICDRRTPQFHLWLQNLFTLERPKALLTRDHASSPFPQTEVYCNLFWATWWGAQGLVCAGCFVLSRNKTAVRTSRPQLETITSRDVHRTVLYASERNIARLTTATEQLPSQFLHVNLWWANNKDSTN
eukprot:2547227-Amphidinium_carterae.2